MAKRVQVVLNEDVLSLGKDGDLVEVAPGYARNFLLPFGKAVPVTPAVMKQVAHRRAKQAEHQAAIKQEALARLKMAQSQKAVAVQNKVSLTNKKTKLTKRLDRLKKEIGEIEQDQDARKQRSEMRRIE